jgi:hypothetical protein
LPCFCAIHATRAAAEGLRVTAGEVVLVIGLM